MLLLDPAFPKMPPRDYHRFETAFQTPFGVFHEYRVAEAMCLKNDFDPLLNISPVVVGYYRAFDPLWYPAKGGQRKKIELYTVFGGV